VGRGARDAAGLSSRLIDRRPGARGGKEQASMLKVVGREAMVDDEVDGRSLLDEIAREAHAACCSRPWRPVRLTAPRRERRRARANDMS